MPFDFDKVEELYPEAGNYMIDPMRYWSLPDGKKDKLVELCESGEYFAQEKIDGALYMFVKTENYSYLFSRSKSTVTGLLSDKLDRVPHIKEIFKNLPAGTVLVGEIFYYGGTSKDTTTIMGALPAKAVKRQEERGLINYYLFDILFYAGENLMDKSAEERYNILEEKVYYNRELDIEEGLGLYNCPFIKFADYATENIPEYLDSILQRGGEGIVLKKKDYPYVEGKRPAWSAIKVKQHDTIDLVCTGLCDPTKEYTGKELDTWQYWLCEHEDSVGNWISELVEGNHYNDYMNISAPEKWTPITKYYFLGWKSAIKIGAYNKDGNLVELGTVSSGLTDDMRRLMTEFPGNYVGHVVALSCMSLDKKNYTLRHPVFHCVRDDKNPEDCTLEEAFK